ncbi:MAG: type II toxin-antitoxin system VapC family toxin [Roseofilum sp. SBFL]|uniref:type II toxin-antitoxin system VapC family toxin n=1 Tax=unclassified Roseofilum TaxID=2620099 RepID=UPI001B165818|nr:MULTISPECIES: type II toxin-antitoxin system VapC family toxin [unclassified Roseofilum]MBP0015527.1 type II toxin-antitoxin system VapC family toxin [Roseofilum sp. SID3]MBP0025574.1 type II toxin-antitoxin system VapC family toxin [Roseofilum sp. SID2]MBP0036609.1 type II toxin-antitoxin system VapC family toxin [Roseofilum sp. SID1]MBP0040516.1 type II toxin-antitoxin system VapC family toxin [Roseofilum sp. SBFL]
MDYFLDTNIVSLAIKNNSSVNQKFREIKAQRKTIFISCITYFEVRRGFLAVDAPKQRKRFEDFCQKYPIILLDDLAILEKAAEIHANLRLRGLPIQTEDVLIAASAMVKNLILVSNDTDLARVEGLSLENWSEL